MNKNKVALKSGMWYTVANFLTKSIGIITTPIFTRLLTKAEYGQFNNFTSWTAIFSIIVTLNLGSTFISARYDFKDRFDEYILSMFSLSSLSALVWIALLNIFSNVSAELLGLSRLYINCMMAYLLFLPAVDLFQTRERYYFKYKSSVAISILTVVGTSLVSVLLVVSLKNRLNGMVFGYVFPTVLIGVVISSHLMYVGKRIDTRYWGYALKFCLPFIPHLLSLTLLNSMDRVMITKICGAEDTALYSLAYSCGHIISILLTSLNSAYAPWLGEKLVNKEEKEVYDFSKVYVSAFMVLATGIMLIAPEILLILGGKKYMDAIYVMPPVAMGCVCQFVYTMYVNVEQFKRRR